MCGILCILDIKDDAAGLRKKALVQVKKLRHRGPDWSGIYSDERAILCHERLAIVDMEHGAQPLKDTRTARVLAVNGEIYNHKELTQTLKSPHDFQTSSDCEPILYLYDEEGPDFIRRMNGIFAFVLYDPKTGEYLIARDPIGVVPLYWGRDKDGNLYVASEMKAILDVCLKVEQFPPGHYYHSREKNPVKYYAPPWAEAGRIPSSPLDLKPLRESLEAAVRRQLMCDVPYGLLISGGVDSSIVAAIAAKYKAKRVETGGKEPAWWPQLHSFSVGLKDAPDLKYAKKVADYIGSIHHEIYFTLQEGIDAVPDVIYHLETFDVTSIRAATPMYLMARKIRTMGIKMILSGEGADEIFGGYLYFHKAPDKTEFHEETVRKLGMLHMYDCLRANKATAAWGVEARVPFIDVEFLEVAMNIDPQEKMITGERKEKWMLRKAFEGYIPDEILWRQKEQFSDGVGYGWIDSLKAHAEKEVTDRMMKNAAHRFPVKTPPTKEGFLYRSIFEGLFPNPAAVETVPDGPSVACSTPTAIRWDKSFQTMQDPSGRAVKNVHEKSY
jgi:asparagine synthase (glutamine-hydrolysing)